MNGGQVFIEMQDAVTGVRIGHATMDVRYYEGGYEPQTVIPGEQITMLMEFQGIDALLPAGTRSSLDIFRIKDKTTWPPLVEMYVSDHILPSICV